jgi:hypothetical protein
MYALVAPHWTCTTQAPHTRLCSYVILFVKYAISWQWSIAQPLNERGILMLCCRVVQVWESGTAAPRGGKCRRCSAVVTTRGQVRSLIPLCCILAVVFPLCHYATCCLRGEKGRWNASVLAQKAQV